MPKISDYDIWFQPCERCGYDTKKATHKTQPYCWKCGGKIYRDYSDRALKHENSTTTV